MFLHNRALFGPAVLATLVTMAHTGLAQETTATSSRITVDTSATEAAASQPAIVESVSPNRIADTSNKARPNAPSEVVASSATVVLATWNGGQLTNQEVSSTLQMRKPRTMGDLQPAQFLNMPAPRQREVVRDLSYEIILYKRALADGIDPAKGEVAERIRAYHDEILARLFFQREVEPKLRQLDEKSAREYYDQNKAELFTSPAYTILQHLHLTTLKPYTVAEGDTLEGLAESTFGSTSDAYKILRGNPPYYRRSPAPEHQEKVPTAPLKAGEKLLLPASDDELTSKKALAKDLYQRLAKGEKFADLASRYSETNGIDPLTSFSLESPGLNPAFRAAVDATDTSFTDFIQTPYGLDLLYIADRATTRTIPFEEVRDSLVTQASTDPESVQRTVEEARRKVIESLREKYALKLNTEALARKDYAGTDPLGSSTPIATAGEFVYTLEEYLADLQPLGKPWQALSEKERSEVVLNAPKVMSHLVLKAAEDLGLGQTDKFREQIESKKVIEVTSEYLKQAMQKLVSASDAELRSYYERNLDRYTSPSQVTLREISKRVNMTVPPERKVAAIEAAKKELGELRSRLKTLPDFEQAAASRGAML